MSQKPLRFKKTRSRGTYARFRYCACLLYTENLAYDWEIKLEECKVPYCFCIHQAESEGLKEHVHLMLMFPLAVGKKKVDELLLSLAEDKEKPAHASHIEIIEHPVSMYKYLVHSTTVSKGKIQYRRKERKTGCGFLIDNYAKSRSEQKEVKRERSCAILEEIIYEKELVDFTDLHMHLQKTFPVEYELMWELMSTKTIYYIKLLESKKVITLHGEYDFSDFSESLRETLGEI